MFEKATRMKLRFPFKGMCTTEDLWDLSVVNLDKIYSSLRTEQKQSEGESLLKKATAEDTLLGLKVDIVKYVVSVKQKEAEMKESKALEVAQKNKIKSIIAMKQDQALMDTPLEELQKLL